uniref:Uncharacterized protein n=1 Tax=uncultured Flavobacteriia bacterium TaxID=212695 RepID=H6RHL4_9BACT|nr:conserved hypothetical protein [uncultured Flavobacteriia bacterium]
MGVNTNTPNVSASLELSSSSRGFLPNRVALQSTTNSATPISNPATGLFVYNTATSSSGATRVQPGLYYWSGTEWKRLNDYKYSRQYVQTSEVIASNTLGNYVNLTGLAQSFTPVRTGTYQIIVNGYYASGTIINSTYRLPLRNSNGSINTGEFYTIATQDGFAEASIRLLINNVSISEKIIIAPGKSIYPNQTNAQSGTPTTYSLFGANASIIVNVDLTAGETYNFNVQGKEWTRANIGRGVFGVDTQNFQNSNNYNDAQRATMTVTLVNEF